MPEKDALDLLLDSALATYADPGDNAGLEQRVLAAVAASRAEQAAAVKPRRRWLPWAIAIPVAAGLLILWLSEKTVHAPSTQPQMAVHQDAARSEPQIAEAPKPDHAKHPSGAKAHRDVAAVSAPFGFAQGRLKSCPDTGLHCRGASLPKLDVFPTPEPLTDQERTLAAVADAGPPSQREALIVSQQHADAPLSIAALNIPPLATQGEGQN